MFKKLSLTPREIALASFSLFCLVLTLISFSVVNKNNSKIEKLLTTDAKESSSTVSLPLESDKEETTSEKTQSGSENISASWNEDTQTFESPDGKLVIDSIEIIKDYKDKPALKVAFTITNKTDKKKEVSSLLYSLVDVQQRNKNTSNSLYSATLTSSEKNHLSDTLNSDGTVSGFYPLELENETDPIIFDFKYDYTSLYEWKYELK